MSIFQKIKEKVAPPRVNVSVALKKPFFILGEPIEGTLQVFSQEELDAVEIRCELDCTERVKKLKNTHQESKECLDDARGRYKSHRSFNLQNEN
jgi:hypothetical protein